MDDEAPPTADAGPGTGTGTGAAADPHTGAARPPTLTPVETDTGRIVQVGTAAFAVATVVLVVLRITAPDWTRAHPDWMWIALAGAVLGLIGLVIIGRHRRLGRTR